MIASTLLHWRSGDFGQVMRGRLVSSKDNAQNYGQIVQVLFLSDQTIFFLAESSCRQLCICLNHVQAIEFTAGGQHEKSAKQ